MDKLVTKKIVQETLIDGVVLQKFCIKDKNNSKHKLFFFNCPYVKKKKFKGFACETPLTRE